MLDPESQRSVEQLEKITIYPSAETILTKKQLEAGIERLEKEEKEYEAALRAKHQIEEASRIRGIIKELTEGIRQGWKRDGLDAQVSGISARRLCHFWTIFRQEIPDLSG